MKITMRNCIVGEVYKLSIDNKVEECKICENNRYSIANPAENRIIECLQCPPEATMCSKN